MHKSPEPNEQLFEAYCTSPIYLALSGYLHITKQGKKMTATAEVPLPSSHKLITVEQSDYQTSDLTRATKIAIKAYTIKSQLKTTKKYIIKTHH